MKIAPRSEQILPKSLAHGSLLAARVTAKFVDAQPLYRQEQVFAREGIELSRPTMAGLLIQLGQRLTPVGEAMQRVLRQGRVIGFHSAPSRAGDVPQPVLIPADGEAPGIGPPPLFFLHSDGYAAYNALAATPQVPGPAGCWAHVRRTFVDAAQARKTPGAANEMLVLIGELYVVERSVRDPATRQAVREERSRPILDAIKAWLDTHVTRTLPKGLLGRAIAYTLGQWPLLTTFPADGHLEIDNNKAENALRPFAIGRKHWLFSGSPRGAEASALFYSLIETAKANSLEPWAYLNYLFEHLPAAKTPAAIKALLPHNLKNDDLKI